MHHSSHFIKFYHLIPFYYFAHLASVFNLKILAKIFVGKIDSVVHFREFEVRKNLMLNLTSDLHVSCKNKFLTPRHPTFPLPSIPRNRKWQFPYKYAPPAFSPLLWRLREVRARFQSSVIVREHVLCYFNVDFRHFGSISTSFFCRYARPAFHGSFESCGCDWRCRVLWLSLWYQDCCLAEIQVCTISFRG